MKSPEKINTKFFKELADNLAKGVPVRCDLPQGGHLHIDRRLPFLCVYRRPAGHADKGTEQLLISQAAYLVTTSDTQPTDGLNELISTIVNTHAETFGAFLLLEIWTATPDTNQQSPLSFRIVAPQLNPPAKLLEAMESALLRVRIADQAPAIQLDYRESVFPPDRIPLLSEEQQSSRCVSLGLEISPVYRDTKTDELFVFSHKEFRHRINRALKRCFYEFAHQYTTHRPAHFHELGPRIITKAVHEVDEKLAEISGKFDLLLFVSPVNSATAWEEFKQHRYERTVEFLYRPRTIDPDLLKRNLFKIPIENVEDPTLSHIYAAKRDELDRQITLLSDRNTPRFLLGSRQLFGDVAPELIQLARSVLQQIPPDIKGDTTTEMLDAEQFAGYARHELEYYRQQDQTLASNVQVRNDIPGIMVSHGNFLIGANAEVSKLRVNATLAHEIGTHVLTYHNGKQQPFKELYAGMAGYEPFQEGLAVLSEYLAGGLGAERLRQLAGRVLAVHMVTEGADFIETFQNLHRQYSFSAKGAFMMAMRTFRGGGYTKDAVYLKGLVEILEYLAKGKELPPLYLGKVAHEYLPLVEELRWRQVLKPPTLVPRLFTKARAQQKLEQLAQGLTVMDLIKEIS